MSEAQWCDPSPEEGNGQDRRQLASDPVCGPLAHLRWRPILITGTLRHVLINHFIEPDHIEDPSIRDAIWTDGPGTGILIESVYRWRSLLAEKRPAILLKRNAFRNVRRVIGDRVGQDEEGNPRYETYWVGSHTLFCIHGSGAGAEVLATETQRELTQFTPALRDSLGLLRLQVTDIGEIGELEEATENFVVPITVAWGYNEIWTLRPEALKLSGFQFEIQAGDC